MHLILFSRSIQNFSGCLFSNSCLLSRRLYVIRQWKFLAYLIRVNNRFYSSIYASVAVKRSKYEEKRVSMFIWFIYWKYIYAESAHCTQSIWHELRVSRKCLHLILVVGDAMRIRTHRCHLFVFMVFTVRAQNLLWFWFFGVCDLFVCFFPLFFILWHHKSDSKNYHHTSASAPSPHMDGCNAPDCS